MELASVIKNVYNIYMPYSTKKVKGGVKNVNKETGKATSKKPMTKSNAEKQKKAIAISERIKYKKKSK